MREGCQICNGPTMQVFSVGQFPLYRCRNCGLEGLSPQPDDQILERIYGKDYFLGSRDTDARRLMDEMKGLTAEKYLQILKRKLEVDSPRLIEIGCGGGEFLEKAMASGFDVVGVELSSNAVQAANRKLGIPRVVAGDLLDVDLNSLGVFDCCVLLDVIEHVRNPLPYLKKIRSLLGSNGICFIVTPSLNSWSARLLGRYWMEYKPEHLFYFNRKNITRMLSDAGFHNVNVSSNWKILNLEYIDFHMQKFHVPIISPLSKLFVKALPKKLRHYNFGIVASGMCVVGSLNDSSCGRD